MSMIILEIVEMYIVETFIYTFFNTPRHPKLIAVVGGMSSTLWSIERNSKDPIQEIRYSTIRTNMRWTESPIWDNGKKRNCKQRRRLVYHQRIIFRRLNTPFWRERMTWLWYWLYPHLGLRHRIIHLTTGSLTCKMGELFRADHPK